jgi:hypothetical protein
MELDYHAYRGTVHEKAIELAKNGFIKTRWLRDHPLKFLAALCSIATPEVPNKKILFSQLVIDPCQISDPLPTMRRYDFGTRYSIPSRQISRRHRLYETRKS